MGTRNDAANDSNAYTLRDKLREAQNAANEFAHSLMSGGDPWAVHHAVGLVNRLAAMERDVTRRRNLSNM